MKNRTTIIVILVAVAVVAAILYQLSLNRQVGNDEQQIAALIQKAETGAERKDARMAMSVVSKNYKDSIGMTYPVLRIRVADALDSAANPDVTITMVGIQTHGSTGEAQLIARVVDRRTDETLFNGQLMLHLQKEKLHRYLIFTSREWRVIRVEGLESVLMG